MGGGGGGINLLHIGPDKHIFCALILLLLCSYLSVQTCVLGAQKNRFIEAVLWSTHNIHFD